MLTLVNLVKKGYLLKELIPPFCAFPKISPGVTKELRIVD